ncbi:hypothetical protein FJZ18_00215 [Candidatus Pacearchaeota archaeon]|nr:hypothetical protein [Candidatus Pacearchaeota archaeon]
MDLLLEPSLSEIAQEVSRVKRFCIEEQMNLWSNAVQNLRKREGWVPELFYKLEERGFLMKQFDDRDFCNKAGIPYDTLDCHWHDIRAAVALWYYERLAA